MLVITFTDLSGDNILRDALTYNDITRAVIPAPGDTVKLDDGERVVAQRTFIYTDEDENVESDVEVHLRFED